MLDGLLFNSAEDPATAGVDSMRRKLWRFVGDVYLYIPEVLPLFPMHIKTLMLYVIWCSRNGINTHKGLLAYASAAVAWATESGHEDCRSLTKMHSAVWSRFTSRARTRIVPAVLQARKLALPASLLECLALQALLHVNDYLHWRDITCWVLAYFTGLRIGHFAPKNASMRHVLRWTDVQISEDMVMLFLRSTKTRAVGCTEGTWQSVAARPDGLFTLDPRRLLLRWRDMSYKQDPLQPLFHATSALHKPMSRTDFTKRLRSQLNVAGQRLGITLDLDRYSGISFRKSAASGLWNKIELHRVAESLDHASLDACMSYGHDTPQSRAANTHLRAQDFQSGF